MYKVKIENDCGDCYAETDAYCDTTTDDGGWMVVQRRQTRTFPFNRRWAEYEKGFGNLSSDFWFGLKSLYCLTSKEMRMDFQFINGTKSYMHYKNFSVGPAETDYKLNVGGFTGVTPTDPLATHPLDGLPFTTLDRDNDLSSSNCASHYVSTSQPSGGWWHRACSHVNPNLVPRATQGIYLIKSWYPILMFEIRIRPLNCE